MDDLVQWLREQIATDRRIAEAANAGPWKVNDEDYAESIVSADDTCVIGGGRWGGEASVFDTTEDALHIVRHDPRAVLAECEAHTAVLDRWRALQDEIVSPDSFNIAEDLLRAVALAYQHRPGYREEWRPA